MNLDKFRLFLAQVCHDMQRIMVKKNKDYANLSNIYSNFERVARICQIWQVDVTKPEGCIMYEAVKKLDRLWKLKKNGVKPENESLQDTVVDSGVYQSLLAGYDISQDDKGERFEK